MDVPRTCRAKIQTMQFINVLEMDQMSSEGEQQTHDARFESSYTRQNTFLDSSFPGRRR